MADNSTKIIISAEDKASAALASISGHVTTLQGALGSLGATLGATLTVGGFAALVKGSIDAADQMNDLSQKVGIAVKDLGTWKLAAESSGASMESIAKGVKGLSAYMHDHAKELKAAGITATDAGGAMTQLADIFKAMPDGVEKTNLAVKLFGKTGMDLIPMLNMGSQGLADMREKAAEYGRRLAILAPQADKFNDLLAEMSLQSKVLGINIGIELVPSLIKFAEQLMEGKKIAGGWTAAMWEFGVLLDPTKGIPESLNQTRVQLEKLHAEMGKGKAQNLADGGMTDLSEIDRNIGLGTRRKAYLEFMQRQSVMEGAGKLGDYRDARDLRLANGTTMSVAEAMAKAGKLNPVAAAAAGKAKKVEIFGPDVKLFDADEAAKFTKAVKDAADAVDAANKSLADHANALGKDVAAAEKALETYGLTESQIADLTLARLKHAKAMEAEQDADEATLGWYDREIEALERIRVAKFAIEAKDVAKKEADDAAKAWKDFARDLESSLTDALMRSFESGDSFGKSFVDNLKNLIKSAALKFAVNMVVGTASGAVQNALGINLGGAGGSAGGAGGIGNLLSGGSSIYNAATGGGVFGSIGGFGLGASSAASELALGASFVGPSASLAGGAIGAGATAGLATGSAGAAGAMSTIAAAAPYVAAAIAVASILGAFGKNKPAPVEWMNADVPQAYTDAGSRYGTPERGPFGNNISFGQHLSRNGVTSQQLMDGVTRPLIALDEVLSKYLTTAEIAKVSTALQLRPNGEHGWNQAEIDGVMMTRLNVISDAIGGWVDKLADTTTGDLQKRYSEIAQLLSIRGDAKVEKLANDMFNATGVWDYQKFATLQTAAKQFSDSFRTDADRFTDYSAAMHKAFESMNLALPETRDGFKSLVEGIDTSTKSGFELYVTLLDLAPTMDSYYAALNSELNVKKQLAAMNENNFATAVDYRRFQAVSANFDPTFAGDYAYNIGRGAITPGAAANDNLVGEIRALRVEVQAGNVAVAVATQETAKMLRRWNGDGMPDVRVVA